MKCINHNSSEYKALNEVVSNKLLLDVLINRWQEVNRSDEFPSVKETKSFADKYNLNADTAKAAPTNIVEAKKAIGIKNPGYGYSDLQKNMLLKRLKAYNLKYNTKHSVNVEKVGQANLYKITFDYKSQSRLNFGSSEDGIPFQKLNSSIQLFSDSESGNFDSASLKDDDLALMLFNQALGLNLTSINQLTWDSIKDNIFFEKEDGSLGVKNLAYISGNLSYSKKATLSDFINQKGLFPDYKVFIGESVIYPNVFETLEENDIIKQAIFDNLFNLSGAFEQVKKELDNHSPETFIISTPKGKFTFPKRFAAGFWNVASTVELLLRENQSSYIQDYLANKRKTVIKDGKQIKPIITQNLTVNDDIVKNAIGLINNSIIENAIKNNTSVKIKVFSNAEYSEDGIAGWYMTNSNTIYLHESMLSPEHLSEGLPLLAHELIHSVTSQAVMYDKAFKNELQSLLNSVKNQSKIKDFYGFTNIDEFLSEAFSSQEFRQLLKDTQFSNIDKLSIWQKFLNTILKLFGKNIKYSETITVTSAEQILNNIINQQSYKIGFVNTTISDSINSNSKISTSKNNKVSVDFTLKAITILQSDKAKQVFAKGEKAKWSLDKILTEIQVPKEQKQLILDLGITDREKIALELASSYSYTVEINTAEEKTKDYKMVDYGDGDFRPEPIEADYTEEFDTEDVLDEDGNWVGERIIESSRRVVVHNQEELDSQYTNTQHYSNLTVPGGTNYTENAIQTPNILNISTDHTKDFSKGVSNMLGWFRSDEQLKGTKLEFDVDPEISQYFKTEEDYESIGALKERGILTKTRRILEVQSPLFQKGRDKADLVGIKTTSWYGAENLDKAIIRKNNRTGDYYIVIEGDLPGFETYVTKDGEKTATQFTTKEEAQQFIDDSKKPNTPNQFLQLLNKDNNWVTFFVKSIIQDSAKQGYEKVLFPTGNTASKVEGHTTLEEFKKEKEDRIKVLEVGLNLKPDPNIDFTRYSFRELKDMGYDYLGNEDGKAIWKPLVKDKTEALNEIVQLKQELERVEKEGFGALKPIYNFYENTVTSILKKIYGKENVRQVTDEYGNTWNEVTIDPSRDLKDIQLKARTAVNQVNQQLSEEAFREIADKLSKKTGIKYNIEDPQTVYDYMVQEGFNMKDITLDNVPAFYYKGSIVFPTDYLEAETAFHEFAHPFVDAILKNNKQLFQTLKTQLQTSVVGRALIAEVKVDYGQETLDEHGWKEVITQALGKLADGSITQVKDKSLWNSLTTLLKNIAEYLQKLFTSTNKTVEPFDLKASTTLEALAKMLKTDATINVGKASVLFQEAEKMAIYGITSNQGRKTIPLINAALYRSITPATYSSKKILKKAAFSLFTGRSYEDFKDTLKEWISVDKASIPQWALDLTEEQYNKRDDAWRLSNGLPQKHNTFKYIGRGRVVNGELIEDINGEDIYDFNNPVFKPGELSKINAGVDNSNFVMGNFAIKVGKDQYGFYTEYHDRWDLDLINKYFQSVINVTQTPFIVSGKMYHAATIDENGDIIYYYTQDATSSDVKYYNNITEELNTELPSDTIPQFKKRDTADSTQPTTNVKPGVSELFESNPELANAVYEALGFRTNINFGDNQEIDNFKNDSNTKIFSIQDILNKETDAITKKLIKALSPYLNNASKIYYQDGYVFKGNSPLASEFGYAATIDGKGNILVFNKDYLTSDVVLHELMHDFLLNAINVNKDTALINELNRIFNKAKQDTDLVDRYSYAFSNLDEFVSEVFGNKGFRQELSYVKDFNLNKNTNIFASVSKAIKDFLNKSFGFEISNNLLDSVFNAIDYTVVNKNQITPQQKQQAQQQYSQYLDTIFPDSKVKDIVYRGGEKEDSRLFQYFTKNPTEAYMYAKANITKGGNITERNPISVIKDNIAKRYNLSENVLLAITDTQLGIDGLQFEGLISKEDADKARELLSTNKDIKNLSRLIELYSIVKIESEEDLMKQFDDTEYQKYKPEYDKVRKELEQFFSREQIGEIKTAIINIKNPYTEEIVQEDLENNRSAYKNGHDGAFLMDGDHFVVKSNTEQIHELGGKQDIEGFKKFVTKPATAIEPTSEETFTQDQLKTITEQLAYVVLSKVDTLDSSTEVDYTIIDKLLESLDARALDDEDLDLSGRISNVVDNLDMFKERVKTYIKDFGFTESEDSREDEDGNIVPINVLNVSDLKDAPSRVKLLVALLPSQDRSNSYLGLPKMVNFQEAWNDLKYAIADLPSTHPDGDVVDGLEAIEGKLYELSKYKPHFRILADKLISQSTSDQLRTQFYNTFTGTKINYSTTLINKKDGQMSVKIIDSDVQASEKLIRNEWNANFVDNIGVYDQMTLFHKAEEVKIVKDLANEFSVSIKKDIKSKTLSKESLSTFKQLLTKIGVSISIDALNSAMEAQNKESEALNLYSLMFDPKLGLYNGIKAIVDKSGQPFFTKNKTFRSEILNQDAFLELAKHEAKFRSDLGQSQILGPDGNAFGLFSKHNALTLILSDYKSNPEALKALDNSSYTKNTRWGKWMLKDKANAQAFNIVVLNNYKQEEGGDKGTSPSELKPGDTLTNVVNRTLKGNYIGLAEADKNNQYTFVGPKPEDSHVRGDLAYMYLENDNAVDVLMGYLEDEINRISDVHEQLFGENKLDVDKQIQYYHYAEVKGDNKANGLKLYILPELDLASFGLLYNSGKPMPLTSDNFHNNKELREYVKNAFLDAVKADVSTLIEVGVINSDFTNNSIDSAIINKHSHAYGVFNAVGDFTLNSIIANVEQTKLFNCDPAMYKTDKAGNLFTDISKRVPATSAQGTSAMVYSDSLGNEVVKSTYTSAVIANIETPSKYFINEDGNVKPEIIDEVYKAVNSDLNSPKVSKESIETSLNGYKDVNRTDAQAWITIDLYRQRLLSFGQWDMKVHEPIFEDIKAGRPITAENMLFFAQPLKTVHVERKFQDGMFVLHYNKQSEAVLHPFLVKDIKLNNILEAMTASGTDHVITLDGKKVGASGIVAIADKKGNIFNSEDIKLNPVTLSTRCVLLQQDLKSKGVKQTLVASQAPKVTFSDVQLSENYIVDGEQLTGEQAVIALHDVTSELSNMGFEELKSELQVDSEGYVNDEAFRAKLIKDLEDSDASSNVLDALREGLPIDAIPGLNITAQSKAMAMTRTAAVKLKQLGASLIQMSDFGFTGVAGADVNTSIIWFKDPSTELVPTRLEKGKIRPSQVLLPYNLVSKIPGWKSMTPEQLKEAIDPECLKGFSYRIPNQGHSSNDVFEIAGILPESCGDVMIAYGEITKKTGSDFDIDKNYIILPNVEFDKASGKLRKIKYNPNRSKNDPFYKAALENRRLDLMSGLLGDPKTYLSNVSPLDNPWLVDLCAELFPATSTNTNLAFFTGTYQANIKLLYDNAKSLVGVVANQLSDHGVAQLDNLLLNTNLGRGVIDKPNGVNRLSPITGQTGVLISIILNAYANGILDAAKDPYITRANINQQTAPVAFMLIRAGVDPNWVVSFIGQPIIKKLISETAKSESSIYVKKRNKEGKIITPIDVVLDGDKLPEDKNWNITLDDLNNNLKNEYYSSNDIDLSILSLFLKYQKIAKTLSASIRASKQDVNGGGKSLNYARALNNDLVNIINSNQILNLDKKIGVLTEDGEVVLEDGLPVMTGSRMVSTYHENSVNKSIVMFSNMFISQSPAFISALNSVLIMQGIEFSTFNIELIDKISNSVYSYLLSHPSSGISREDYNSLFFGNNSIAVRLKNIKNLKAKLAANLLIENMKYDIAYTTTDPSFVGLNNAKQLSKQSKDSLYLAWKELAKEDKKLALDLITYSYYASGFTKTLTSFHEHIPVSLLKELGFTDFIKGISKDVYDASFLYKAANQVIKNLHASTELVPKLPFVDPYGSMSTDHIFVLGDKLKDQYKISDITEEHAEHKRFVKYRNRFYKLAGYTTLNDNPVYVRTNTLGFNERGNTIKEYFFDGASNTSIIPNNNVSLPVDIAAIIGDPSKITPPTVVTKLKTIARTSQKTNLTEAEIEKIAKQKQKDCL